MYVVTLLVHSWLRWVVLVLAVVAIGHAVRGWSAGRAWTDADRKPGVFFAVSLDIQVLLGFVLYGGVSPLMATIFASFGGAMKDPVLRFWAVEHVSLMVLAMVLAHIGVRIVKRGGAAAFRNAAVFYGLALLSALLVIPWPFRAVGRPLLRLE